ncbi:MAG: nuclear transport factor 2 family protein [Micavibrio sp.]
MPPLTLHKTDHDNMSANPPPFQRPLEDYIAYLERLTPRSVRLLEKLAAPEMRFIDPFYDVRGVDAVVAAYDKIMGHAARMSFHVTDRAWGRDGYTAYLRWNLVFEDRAIDGMAEIVFGPDGKIVQHTNHWDSGNQVMARLPVIKWVWKIVKGKLS